ncbi:lanthionine synthetase C family protein [Staphylococcus delphini]|uniref:lanthionine synthetase C family protein n=1 Tax=Staphylococcus delphini TaxID=53344 RepID=UPI0023B2C0F2|nr:lanthionine synthetase C family protein [Staphylococcus delphini]MDE9751763.1 lanthionine synthetase C family protein [Staphylococcus delphini]MDE9789040.1 lanthionine synthetase C family protein [Staphylococcus delphini]MDE9791327.1 lanthionine synthetase C family protein [Staphylococcus delphini]MDE9793657.1 lanthionine synthetase C family protein [Staphylococcus delphini]MDE9795993.1 lanthionine synthetase C family protein [Staphylococcus delphini]
MEKEFMDLIEKISNLEISKKNIEFNYGEETIYKVSVATGYPGIALLLYETYKYTNDIKYYKLCNEHLSETINIIQANPMYSTSLFSGTMGILFVLATCSDGGSNYRNITTQLLNEYDNIFDEIYSTLNKQVYNITKSIENFDLVNGVCGSLVCLLHISDVYGSEIHANLNTWIEKLTIFVESLINNKLKYKVKGGFFSDLGVSHGISGAINVLNASYNRGFMSTTTLNTLKKSRDFLIESIIFHRNSCFIPNTLDDNMLNHRDAWCYGTPGVSFVLNNISRTLYDEKAISISKFLSRETLRRTKEERKIISPTFCHGYSGIAIINKILQNEELEKCFYKEIINSKNSYAEFIFRDIEHQDNGYEYKDSVSLLEGSSGVLLTLLSRNKFHSLWYKLFCFI